MDACEPRVRRRGFFLHSDTGEVDTGDYDAAEGFRVRARITRSSNTPRQIGTSVRHSAGRRSREEQEPVSEALPQIRSGSVTGSRQRAH